MSRAVTGLYQFGPFRVDLEQRVFTREHQVLPLPPKTFDLLVLLVQSPRRAFSKQELMSSLWPDTFVEEANLSFQISVLRKALGEDGARWVETVPKHGYRFSADVRATVAIGHVVGRAAQRERTFLRDPEAQHQEGMAGRRDGHGGLARGRRISHGRARAAHRPRSELRPPSLFRSLRIRDTSGRRASRPTEAGSPFPGTALRRTTTTSTSNWPGPGSRCA